MQKMHAVVVAVLMVFSCVSMAQQPNSDMIVKKTITDRIKTNYGVVLDWKKNSMAQLVDVETRLSIASTIKREYGITMDWRRNTSDQLMDALVKYSVQKKPAKSPTKLGVLPSYKPKNKIPPPANAGGTVNSFIPSGRMAVVAPTLYNRDDAQAFMQRNIIIETTIKNADQIIVSVRSILDDPMSRSFDSIKELQDQAERQLNIIGDICHIYIYRINDNLSADRIFHTSYKTTE